MPNPNHIAEQQGQESYCNHRSQERGVKFLCVWIAIGALAFHAAYTWSQFGPIIGLYLFALVQLAKANSWRKAFYSGLALGLLIAVLRLDFFWTIFSGGAVALWLVYAFWIGVFVALARLCITRFSGGFGWLMVPFVWCGLEYFRSELYFLRFSWLSPGLAFGLRPQLVPLNELGVYGVSFLFMGLACLAAAGPSAAKLRPAIILILGVGGVVIWGSAIHPTHPRPASASLRVMGVQMEFPSEKEVLVLLNEAIREDPESELLVLSEYTFSGPVPEKVMNWCRDNHRYLIAGGKDPAPGGNFYNTAFVISPAGEIVFKQAKCVPIQFFKDGLPAQEQKLWESPWGRIGICICYDLSYRRVVDELIRLGAEALIVPTMDVADWGSRQHLLHARVAPVRAAEYGVPIFRLASSGISQVVDDRGQVLVSAPFAACGAMVAGALEMRGAGHVPFDRWLAPFATGITAILAVWLSAGCLRGSGTQRPSSNSDDQKKENEKPESSVVTNLER
jgi:apolipoprotein N-acyltransferase